jgi:DNA-binding transcriptional regulator YiaG
LAAQEIKLDIDTSTPEGFRETREDLGLSVAQVARLLQTNERTVKRWESEVGTAEDRLVHPTAALVMDWFLGGFRPPEWPEKMTGNEMLDIRYGMGMSVSQMAEFLDAEDETILKWESDDRGPPAIVQQVLTWLWHDKVPHEFRPSWGDSSD